MKILKYNLCTKVNHGTEQIPVWEDVLYPVIMGWNEANEELAKQEAYNGEYTIESVEETTEPTQLDKIEAQVTYTAMMTDTMLGV
jgi:hypothetical protein